MTDTTAVNTPTQAAGAPAAATPIQVAQAPVVQQTSSTPPATFQPAAAQTAPAAPPAVQWEKTGDPATDLFLSFAGRLGYGPDSPAMKAAQSGDMSLLRASLATRQDAQGWQDALAVGEAAIKGAIEKERASAKATEEAVHAAVGGAENWAKVQEWVKANADPGELVAVNAGLKVGGIVAKALAAHLNGLYTNANGGGQAVVKPGAASGTQDTSPITAAEFAQISRQLYNKHGRDFESHPDYKRAAARLRG